MTVSVVIPCFNQARFLGVCLDSLLAQSWAGAQIIVVDDGSTDSTATVASAYGSRITYVAQANEGLSGARNTGLRRATGEFLHFLDADDFVHPHFHEKTRAALDANPDAVAAYTGYFFVDAQGALQRTIPVLPEPENPFHHLLTGNTWPCHAMLVRSAAVRAAGLFDPCLRSCEDWDFWLRISAQGGRFVPVAGELAYYRRHANTLSQNVALMYETALSVIDRHAAFHGACNACRRSSAQGRAFAFANWVAPQLDQFIEQRDAPGYLRFCAGLARQDLLAAWRCITHLRFRKRRLAAWLSGAGKTSGDASDTP